MTSYLLIPDAQGLPSMLLWAPKQGLHACALSEEPKVPQGPGEQLGSHRDVRKRQDGSSPATHSRPPHPAPTTHPVLVQLWSVSH